MIKGDRIKLVKPMGVFTNIGEVCEVVEISSSGVISFRFGEYHLGCMSYDEFEKYFELIEKVEKPKLKWSDWKPERLPMSVGGGLEFSAFIKYRSNQKEVQVKYKNIKARSSCHEDDIFDLEKGLFLAKRRLAVKILEDENNKIAKII